MLNAWTAVGPVSSSRSPKAGEHMGKFRDPLPDLDPRRKGPKRHFGNLRMPPVGHRPGAVAEQFQFASSPRNRRLALVLLGLSAMVVAGGLLAFALRGRLKTHPHPNPACPSARKPDAHPAGGGRSF